MVNPEVGSDEGILALANDVISSANTSIEQRPRYICPTERDFEVHYRRFSLEDRVTRGTPEPTIIQRGRPKKYRKAFKSGKVPKDPNAIYLHELQKMLKRFKWQYFVTATFDRRIKTPMSIYENVVTNITFKDYLPDGWEPLTWTPSVATAVQMMEAFRTLLEKQGYKRWRIFYVVEEHKDGTPHVHFLCGHDRVKSTSKEFNDKTRLGQAWRFLRGGYIRVEELKESQKSIDYCLKYVTKDALSWDFLKTDTPWRRYKIMPKNIVGIEQFLSVRKMRINAINSGVKVWKLVQ
jgi:hypothetical protein